MRKIFNMKFSFSSLRAKVIHKKQTSDANLPFSAKLKATIKGLSDESYILNEILITNENIQNKYRKKRNFIYHPDKNYKKYYMDTIVFACLWKKRKCIALALRITVFIFSQQMWRIKKEKISVVFLYNDNKSHSKYVIENLIKRNKNKQKRLEFSFKTKYKNEDKYTRKIKRKEYKNDIRFKVKNDVGFLIPSFFKTLNYPHLKKEGKKEKEEKQKDFEETFFDKYNFSNIQLNQNLNQLKEYNDINKKYKKYCIKQEKKCILKMCSLLLNHKIKNNRKENKL